MVIDPTLQYERRLRYMEKHAGWEIFRMVFWGVYIFIIGLILLIFYKQSPTTAINLYAFFGWGLTLFAIFYILYGFSMSLHLKLMRKYA
jgi:hypothetical protein